MAGIIVLITDFGTKDPYSAVMKGVILWRDPEALIVDATHEISPQDIREASLFLADLILYYPEKTVFTAVVDPGVGTDRRIIVVKIRNRTVVVPDNGLISEAINRYGADSVFRVDISSGKFNPGTTFHGRDIFAPVSADLISKDFEISDYLEKISKEDIVFEEFVKSAIYSNDFIKGGIYKTDKFGNIISNIKKEKAEPLINKWKDYDVYIDGIKAGKIKNTYGYSNTGELISLWNSSNCLEIALVNKSAADYLNINKESSVVEVCRI
ncbi:MAG: SAM hydrolase/SAM-dependent halogenase family protein [Thermodesulfobacteriota bacterium]